MMKTNPTRLQSHFEAMSLIGKIGETGTCRPAHTELEKQGFELAASWMKAAGMKTLGITNTVSADELRNIGANSVTKSLADWMPSSINRVF